MHVRFGLYADGLQPQACQSEVGTVAVGPLGLLALLEAQLGLGIPSSPPGEAAFNYLQCLRAVSAPGRFFHRSLAIDPINVARTLLAWRAAWYEAGWDGTFADDAPARLADMAAVERQAGGRVPPSVGERLRRIAQALDERVTQIEQVELLTPRETLPRAWRDVLAKLPAAQASGLGLRRSATPGSDLFVLQTALQAMHHGDRNADCTPVPMRRDGSLVLVEASSPDLSAQLVAELLLASGDRTGALLIAEKDGIILDNALSEAGLPRCGFRYHSRFRATTQVLGLCLGQIWAPVDAERTLQFLLHPVSPLARSARLRLADAVAESPGIGGPAWLKALADIERRTMQRHDGDDAKRAEIASSIAYWLEGGRFDPRAGAPIAVLVERAQRVANWAGSRLGTDPDEAQRALFARAMQQADALITGLALIAGSGRDSIPRLELEQLVDEVTREGDDPAVFAEAGHVLATTSPGAVTTPCETLVWWNPLPPSASASGSYPWSRKELAALRAHGVDLPEMEEVLRRRGVEWLRPVLNATERLVLAVHGADAGRHPILSQIECAFEQITPIRVEHALLHEPTALALLELPLRPLPPRLLPAPRRWWSLPADCSIVPRDVESYSSLAKLCDHPHQWVLHYAARLKSGRATAVADGPLLHGNLGHRLIEAYFGAHPDWREQSDATVSDWVQATLPGIIEREGVVLLAPGRGAERQRISTTIERALLALLAQLRAASVLTVVPESRVQVAFAGRQLTGAIDLLLTDRSGKRGVVDVKWSGERFRGALLEANRALQLATYAYLQKTLDGGELWPFSAFFILATGNLLAHDAAHFPRASVTPSRNGETDAHLWNQMTASCAWRWRQLEQGRIEVVTERTAPDADSTPPAAALAGVEAGDPYDDFERLTGWEAYQ